VSELSIRRLSASELRDAGRQPEVPFCVALSDGSSVYLNRLLRVLPGKRIVGEGEWKGRRALVKLFVDRHSERHWTQEKSGIATLNQAGIPTPDLLLADALPTVGHVVLTDFLDAAQTLAERWAPMSALPAGNSDSVRLLGPAFALLGKLHAAGSVQNDLHFGNFLHSSGTLYAIDGDAVRVMTPSKPLDEKRATANLALLLAQLPPGWDAHQTAFLAAYASGGGIAIGDSHRLAKEVARARRWRLNDYLGKSLRDCTLFSVRRSASRFCAVRRAEAGTLNFLLNTPDTAICDGRLLKDGGTCTVARIDLPDRTVVIKRYNLKSTWHAIGRLWRPSRAWHSWREGHRLRFLGINTPEPLALIEERIGPLRRRAFLVNAFCPGISLLEQLSPDREPDVEMASAILSLFETLYQQRISHGDLKATNLLWHEGQLVVIDLDAMTQHTSSKTFARAWRRERARLLRNWPTTSILHRWLDENLIPASN